MTLVTICPACATQFFVTQEQLTANKGKVRCGQCKHVFNGNEKLNELASDAHHLQETPSTETTLSAELTTEAIEQTTAVELPAGEIKAENPAAAAIENLAETTPPVTTAASAPSAPQLIDFIERPNQTEPEPQKTEDYFAESSQLTSKLNSKPKQKSPRWLMILLTLILLLLAIGQSIYYFRTPISSQLPATKAYLVQACQWLGCEVELPKQLDSLAIDDSEMREDAEHEHVLQFSITLVNKANIALRYPSIELTLTDSNDTNVIRRTFTADEYLLLSNHTPASNVAMGFSAKDRLNIKLALNTHDVTVAGYRLELVE